MNPMVNTIADGTGQLREAISMIAAAVVPVLPRRTKPCHTELDDHTKQDIGIEPGSITWL